MLRRALLAACCALGVSSAGAWFPHGVVPPPPLTFPLSYYATFANGPPAVSSFFPVAVWHQLPYVNFGYSGGYTTLADAAAAANINIFDTILGWPNGFGTDNGELAATKNAGIYLMGGKFVDYSSGVSAGSVNSIQALIASVPGSARTVIGYSLGDEPSCGASAGDTGHIATEVAAVQAYDATRLIAVNFGYFLIDNTVGCPSEYTAATAALTHNSYDAYPMSQPPSQTACLNNGVNVQSDFISTPNDCIWTAGLGIQNLKAYAPTKPVWGFAEVGSNTFGDSVNYNGPIQTTTVSGSNVLVNASPAPGSGKTLFTSAWVGLTLAGNGNISPGATVVSVSDSTHLVMSANAVSSGTAANTYLTGGENGGGCRTNNLCNPFGHQFRATPASVNGQVWNMVISGALGIIWFCHDTASHSFCLGDAAGGAAAQVSRINITYIGGKLAAHAPKLNATEVGACSMQNLNFTISSSCTNGSLTMATADPALPGLAMLKSLNGKHYLFAMSDRNSASGAAMTFTLAGLAGQTATVIDDSNTQYDNAHNNVGATFTLNGSGAFTDTFGANGNHYQVRVYEIQ